MHNTINTIFLDKLSLEKPLRENQFYKWGNILNFSKSRDTKFLASHWQNSDNLLISPADNPHCYPHANTAPLLTLQDNLLSLQIASQNPTFPNDLMIPSYTRESLKFVNNNHLQILGKWTNNCPNYL